MKAEVFLTHATTSLSPEKDHAASALGSMPLAAAGPLGKTNPNHFVTEGEKKFDFWAYTGLGYIANVVLSLAAVFFIERTRPGQSAMNWLMKGADKAPTALGGPARFLASKSFFLVGGFAVLAPIKWMEDKKHAIVKKWNREIYGEKAEHDAQILQSEKEIAEAPKQSWASIMGSRIISLIPFYFTVGLLWENKSPLGKITNSNFRGMDKQAKKDFLEVGAQATKAGDLAGQSAFSKTMGKGIYFDRLIAAMSRWLGKGFAYVTGDQQAVARITSMQQQFPGMIKEGVAGSLTRDPNQSALPYYFISEAITSAIVARAVYLMTRMLGPLWGKKAEPAATPEVTAPVAANDDAGKAANDTDLPKVDERPQTKIAAAGLQHQAEPAAAMAAAR